MYYKVLYCVSVCVVCVLSYDCNIPPGQSTGPKLPPLPNQYEARIEANIKQKGKSIEVTEYYDYLSNRAAIMIMSNGKLFTSIINFKQMERYDIHSDGTCKTTDLKENHRSIFGFTAGNGSSHVDTVTDVFKFGQKFNETYLGRDKVRGIPVNHWRSCQQWKEKKTNFTLDYYFTTSDYHTASGHKEIPVRAVINGTAVNVDSKGKELPGTHNFSHVYDFVFFRPGPVKDPLVFEIPRGTICPGRKPTLKMPILPEQFSLNLEIDTFDIDKPSTERIYFDYNYGLIRSDHINLDKSTNKITTIEDFNLGVEYIIDVLHGNCTINKISNDSYGSLVSQTGKIKMRHAEDILKYNNRTYIYQGQRIWRGLSANAWANLSRDGIVQEILFLKKPNLPDLKKQLPVLIGLYSKNISKTKDSGSEKFVHFYNYQPTHSDLDIYDISLCYSDGPNKLNIMLTIKGDYVKDVEGYRSYFYTATRSKLAKLSGVKPLRIAHLQITGGDKINVLFSILDKSPISSDNSANVGEAFHKLVVGASTNPQFSVHYPHNNKMFYIEADSVSTITNIISTSDTFSSGAMAGVGVGMLVVGLVIGIATMFIIHRRLQRPDDCTVPYTRSKD
ncbi:uncharacterized protein LOC126816884 isoform X2 [Patella vulgata]|nr:uncharacterized protein LOC126816884 isoform X2 [Patella vulgata]